MSYNRDPLYYHTKVNFDELLEKREKAIWFANSMALKHGCL